MSRSGRLVLLTSGPVEILGFSARVDVIGDNQPLSFLDLSIFSPLVRRVWRRSARLLAISGNFDALAHLIWPAAVIETVRNSVAIADFTPPLQLPRLRLIFVGRLSRGKSMATLLDAAQLLEPRFPELQLAIVGRGPLGG
jgi:glycosyltransferase involved in cell wall biosynthesis